MPDPYWSIAPEWAGETAFIVGSGTTLCGFDAEQLRGEKIIVINASYGLVPFADFLIFSDSRFWEAHRQHLIAWKGRTVCVSHSPRDGHLLKVRRKIPPADNQANDCLALQFTTATAAIDLAAKLGVARIILLGVDGRSGPDGKTHHHKPHPWRPVPGWETKHRSDLQKMVEPMKNRGVEIFLGTPSAYSDLWPSIDLADVLKVREAA